MPPTIIKTAKIFFIFILNVGKCFFELSVRDGIGIQW